MIGNNLFIFTASARKKKCARFAETPPCTASSEDSAALSAKEVRSRWYLDTTSGLEKWDCILSLDKKAYNLVSYVNFEKKKTHIEEVIVVRDALLGLMGDGKTVMGQLTPDILGKKEAMLDVALMEGVNTLGKIALLVAVPNSETSFLACVKNLIYPCNLDGRMIRFEMLEDRVKRIQSVDFNHTSSLAATNDGLFEIEAEELPNMVRVASLPRQISHSDLKGGFRAGTMSRIPSFWACIPPRESWPKRMAKG